MYILQTQKNKIAVLLLSQYVNFLLRENVNFSGRNFFIFSLI